MLALLQAFLLPTTMAQVPKAIRWFSAGLFARGDWLVDKMKDQKIKNQAWEERMGKSPSRKALSEKKLKKMQEAIQLANQHGLQLPIPEGAPEDIFEEFSISEENLPESMKEFAGNWLLSQEEKSMLFHGLKVRCLSEGEGAVVDRLMSICEAHALDPGKLKFLWSEFRPDLENLRRLSNNRLEDDRMRKSLTAKV